MTALLLVIAGVLFAISFPKAKQKYRPCVFPHKACASAGAGQGLKASSTNLSRIQD
jgi:hypothetical protein